MSLTDDTKYIQGDNAKIDGIYFHVLDEHGERTPASSYLLNKNKNTYFVIHGFTSGVGDKWLDGIKDFDSGTNWKIEPNDFKQWENFDSTQHSLGLAIKSYDPSANVVIVDWGNFSTPSGLDVLGDLAAAYAAWSGHPSALLKGFNTYYAQANEGTDRVSRALKEYIDSKLLPYDGITLVGHSLGAHISGKTGKLLGKRIENIIAMDPAGPGFERYKKEDRLSYDDAENVYAIHTSATLGYKGPLALYDLYINANVNKSLFGGLKNYYSHPDTYSFDDVSKHSFANHITALMFAESSSMQDKFSPTFLASHLYNPEISSKFYGGETTKWNASLSVVGNSVDPLTNLKLNIENLFEKKYFSDQYFDWEFDTLAPYTDHSGFWYDDDYLNRWNEGYQQDSLGLTASPDTSSTTWTTPSWLAWWGPIDGGVAWFDERNQGGQLNFEPDKNEIQSRVVDGLFKIELENDQPNNYVNTLYPVFHGFNKIKEEVRIANHRQVIDFRDGLVMIKGTEKSPLIDKMTGMDYGLPLVGLPRNNINIITTLKYLPTARWRDDLKFPKTDLAYRFTPQVRNRTTASLFRGISDKFFDDNFNIYSLFLGGSPEDNKFGINAIAYQYALMSLVQTTNELLDYVGVDYNSWSAHFDAKNAPNDVLAIYSIASALSHLYSDTKSQYDNLNLAKTSGFSPFSKADVTRLWDAILRTTPTFIATNQDSPLEMSVQLDRIAKMHIKRAKNVKQILKKSFEVGGKDLMIPAIVGSKQHLMATGEGSQIYQSIDDAFMIKSDVKYRKRQNKLLNSSVYYSNYTDSNHVHNKGDLISLHIDRESLHHATNKLANDQNATINFTVKLTNPAPIYGLSVNFLLGGRSLSESNYRLIGLDRASFNFKPGSTKKIISVELFPSFYDTSRSLQLSLLNTTSGYEISSDESSIEIGSSNKTLTYSHIAATDLFRNKKSTIIGCEDDDKLIAPSGRSVQNILMYGDAGADLFELSRQSKGLTFLQDFNPYEGDKIILNADEFGGKSSVSHQDFHFFGGKLFYNSLGASSGSEVLALLGDGINDTENFFSTIPLKKESYIRIV